MVSQYLDNYYALRFVYLLTRAWTDTDAYKLGMIDDKGNIIIPDDQIRTPEQKEALTKFHVLVFNIKKMLEKIPLGKTTVARYAAALALIKEHLGPALHNKDVISETFFAHTKYLSEDGETVASTGSLTTGVDNVDGILGKKKKPVEEDEEHWAGHRVFKTDSETFHKSRLGKTRYARYKTYVGEDEIGQKIREYGRKNPGKGIILKNSTNGAMLFLKRRKKPE